MATANQTITQVREHIIAGRYRQARILLKTSTHPRTDEWLVKLNALQREKTQPEKSQRDVQEMSALTRPSRATRTTTTKIPTRPTQSTTTKIPVKASATEKVKTAEKTKAPEKALYRDHCFTVTREHVMIEDAIFPLRQIESVRVHAGQAGDNTISVIVKAVIGLVACVTAIILFHDKPAFNMIAVPAAAGIFGSICWLIWQLFSSHKPQNFALRFNFNTIEEDVYQTDNQAYITLIVDQINQALTATTRPTRRTA